MSTSWREQPATAKQIRLLECWDFDDLDIITRGEASEIISEEIEDRNAWRDASASEAQLCYLEALGVDFHPRITKAEASEAISEALEEEL